MSIAEMQAKGLFSVKEGRWYRIYGKGGKYVLFGNGLTELEAWEEAKLHFK